MLKRVRRLIEMIVMSTGGIGDIVGVARITDSTTGIVMCVVDSTDKDYVRFTFPLPYNTVLVLDNDGNVVVTVDTKTL